MFGMAIKQLNCEEKKNSCLRKEIHRLGNSIGDDGMRGGKLKFDKIMISLQIDDDADVML